jgi:choline dehydrogenase-like flavoprotein
MRRGACCVDMKMEDERSAVDHEWDVIVIGTGMGGATIGYSLAKEGFSVLLVEKGRGAFHQSHDVPPEDPTERLNEAHWPDQVISEIDDVQAESFVPLGCGVGGSTMLFGAALERFDRTDLDHLDGQQHPTGGWPISYDGFRPWYEAAEALYHVRGTRDPLDVPIPSSMRRPAPASEQDRLFMEDFAGAGLHPYRLHVGMAFRPDCRECIGKICPLQCKSDAKTICLDPAVEQHNAVVLSECEVTRLDADDTQVTAVHCVRRGGALKLRGRIVILSAGTYRSAALMLASANENWPEGVGNRNGLVGRNLMFHSSDWFAVWPRRKGSSAGYRKTIGFRDLYLKDGARLGSVQSTGLSAGYGLVLVFLRSWFDRSMWRRLRFVRPFLRIPAKLASIIFGNATIFAMIMEDIADVENRLVLDRQRPGRIRFVYKVSPDLRARTAAARLAVREKLAGFRKFWLQADVMVDLGHPTGTCRFGNNPASSVLDRTCRVHGLDNLYVVDGSFMPSSGGTNPSLTIAANALRVGEVIGKRLRPA